MEVPLFKFGFNYIHIWYLIFGISYLVLVSDSRIVFFKTCSLIHIFRAKVEIVGKWHSYPVGETNSTAIRFRGSRPFVRDKWILEKSSFLSRHIYKIPSRDVVDGSFNISKFCIFFGC